MFAKLHLSKSLHDSFFITAQQSSASTSKFGVPVFCRHSQMLKATSLYFKKRNCPCRKRTIRKHNPPAQIPRSVSGNGHQFPPPSPPCLGDCTPRARQKCSPICHLPHKKQLQQSTTPYRRVFYCNPLKTELCLFTYRHDIFGGKLI